MLADILKLYSAVESWRFSAVLYAALPGDLDANVCADLAKEASGICAEFEKVMPKLIDALKFKMPSGGGTPGQ